MNKTKSLIAGIGMTSMLLFSGCASTSNNTNLIQMSKKSKKNSKGDTWEC